MGVSIDVLSDTVAVVKALSMREYWLIKKGKAVISWPYTTSNNTPLIVCVIGLLLSSAAVQI